MTVKELIEHLSKFPQDALVVYSSDDEGNDYHAVEYEPSLGKYTDDGEFSEFIFEDDEEHGESDGRIAVCVN